MKRSAPAEPYLADDAVLVGKMEDVQILDETFVDDPPQYRRGDKQINICCEL